MKNNRIVKNRSNIQAERQILDYKAPMDYASLMDTLQIFSDRYPFISITYMGTSVLGRGIPMVSLGEGRGKKSVLYVGCHHGMEWITTVILLRFINEFCECMKSDQRMYSINLRHMFRSRTIHIIPQLNVDGADIQINGAENTILRERLVSMNGGTDFSSWQANARGVDLNHNYNAGFFEYKKLEAEAGILGGGPTRYSGEGPESEPEVASLCSLLRYSDDISAVCTFHSQGEEIYYTSGGRTAPRSATIAKLMSKMCGYTLSVPDGLASYGGLTDWCISELNKPSFTIECGKGKNPLPLDMYYEIYAALKELLFTMPILC